MVVTIQVLSSFMYSCSSQIPYNNPRLFLYCLVKQPEVNLHLEQYYYQSLPGWEWTPVRRSKATSRVITRYIICAKMKRIKMCTHILYC